MADPARWLGGHAPLAVARTQGEARQKLASISKEERNVLTPSEYGKLKRAAEVGLENKFTMMEPLSGNKPSKEQLKSIYSVTMRVEEFRKSLQAYDMDDVFMIASAYETHDDDGEDWPAVGARPINLFSSSNDVDMELVKQASRFFTTYGQESHVENLIWSGTKLLNSCDDLLRQKIEEQTIGWPIQWATGPVYFIIMMENILGSSPESLRGLISVLQTTTLKSFDGENVTEFVSFARGAVEQLQNHNALPIDALTILANALKDCDTPDFVGYVTTMYNNHVQGVKNCTIDTLLRSAEKEYINLTSASLWKVGKHEQNSVFFAGKCFDCGKPGHKAGAKECAEKKNPNDRKGHGNQGRGGRGRGNTRGGRGGRGRGRSGGRGGGVRYQVDKTPPRPGEAKVRTKNGRTETWCGRHGYWTWGDIAHESETCPLPRGGTGNDAGNDAHVADGTGDNATQDSRHVSFAGTVTHALDF